MPRAPHHFVEDRLLTDAALRRLQEAHRTGFLSFDMRSGRELRGLWDRTCTLDTSPHATVEHRKATAELWVDIWGYTPSPWEFPHELQQQLRDILSAFQLRNARVTRHTVRASRVPRQLADTIMAALLTPIHAWLRTLRVTHECEVASLHA